jgi:hypothetical protein
MDSTTLNVKGRGGRGERENEACGEGKNEGEGRGIMKGRGGG